MKQFKVIVSLVFLICMFISCAPKDPYLKVVRLREHYEKTNDIQPLLEALTDTDLRVRMAAAEALGDIDNPRSVEALKLALEDRSSYVREEAAIALKKLGYSSSTVSDLDDNGDRKSASVLKRLEDISENVGVILSAPHGAAAWDADPTKDTMEAVVQLGHSANVSSVAFSPDGRLALSGSDDSTLKLWEISTGREIRTFKGLSSHITSVAFSPNGRFAFSGCSDGTLALWEVSTGRNILVGKGHSDWVYAVAFSPDGRFAMSGSEDKTVKIWGVSTGRIIRAFKHPFPRAAIFRKTTITFSPDGRSVLWGHLNLDLWDLSTGHKIRRIVSYGGMLRFGAAISSTAFSPDGRHILLGGMELDLWEVSTGRKIRKFERHTSWIQSVAFSPDGRKVLAGNKDGTLTVWEVATGRIVRTFVGHSHRVHSVVFSPDGRFILSGDNSGILRLWELSSGRRIRTFRGHSDKVKSIAHSPDGSFVLCGSDDKALKLWNLITGKNVRTFRRHAGGITAVAFSPGGRYALSGSDDKTLKLWDVFTGRDIRTLKGHSDSVTSVSFSPDGRFVLSGSKDETLKLWDVSTGDAIRTFEGHTHWLTSVAFSPNNRLALSGARDDTVKLWNLSNGRNTRTLQGHSGDVNIVAISPDGRSALSGSWQSLQLWDLPTGGEIRELKKHSGNITSVVFSPDGRLVLSGSDDSTLKLWEVSSGRDIRTFKGHLDAVTSVAFLPHSRFVLSGSRDMTTRIWDMSTGNEIARLISSSDGEWIIVTPDGYYNTSPEGSSLIHWVFPGGLETFTFEQFESRFKRPDVIKARLSGDLNAGKPAPTLTRPPKIEMADHLGIKKISGKNYTLNLTVSALEEVKTVRVFVNGKPSLELPVNEKKKRLSLDVALFSGANRLTAIAYDEKGFSSTPKYVDVISQDGALAKPDLHVLGIGISHYPRLPSRWQLEFAHTDAQALVTAFQNQAGKLFGNVHHNLLTNEKATVANIIEALDVLSGMSENDVAVILMAGHGIKASDGIFYFFTASGSLDEPHNGGLSWKALGQYLSRIKGRVILLLDACHSGSIVTETVVPNDELAQQFFGGERGGVMVLSASKGRQFSMESPDIGGGFGVFTYAFIQSIGPKAKEVDNNGDGFVEFMELVDYVRAYVDKMTKGEQTPWLSRKELFGDLPLAVVN